jgi:hypothetical protein
MHGLAEALQNTALSVTIQSVSWIIPLLQSIHILMIGVVFISSLMIMLRILGVMRADEPFARVWARFAPWMWGAFLVMAATGALLVAGEPVREASALSFWLKMVLVAVGLITTGLVGRSLRLAPVHSGAEFPATAKAVALALVVLWLAVIFLGRAIAYDKEVWGALSLHG